MSDTKIALLCVGGLFSGLTAWGALMWWIGTDFDSHAEAFRKTYREGKPVEIPKDSK